MLLSLLRGGTANVEAGMDTWRPGGWLCAWLQLDFGFRLPLVPNSLGSQHEVT